MYTAKIENKNGEILQLTQHEMLWQVVSITGLNPPAAQINMTPIASMDGSILNSSRLDTRQIVITLKINGSVEANRQTLYRFFRTKETVRFYFKNQNRDVWIDGSVETCEVNLFEFGQLMQIAITCPQPYFKSIDEIITEISSVTAAFVFPFSINIGDPVAFSTLDINKETLIRNDTEAESGLIFDIHFRNSASKVKIFDITTNEFMELNYSFEAGDTVRINTNRGQKSIRLIRDAEPTNLFSHLAKGSSFFQLIVGDNYFSYLADDGAENGNVDIIATRWNYYRGV